MIIITIMESDGEVILTGKYRITRRKTCPGATMYTKNLTWTDPGANHGLRGDSPATIRLSYGTAKHEVLFEEFSVLSYKNNAENEYNPQEYDY
jgi:hypothetical protein